MKDKVKVAIIDSALTKYYIAEETMISEYISLKMIKREGVYLDEIEIDRNNDMEKGEIPSHATGVLNTIVKYTKGIDVDFSIYNVFDDNGISSGAVIIEACEMILKRNIDVVVMSLTCSRDYKEEFEVIIEEFRKKEIIFICAGDNHYKNNFPADMIGVLGVQAGDKKYIGGYRYSPLKKMQFESDVQGEFVGRKGRYHFFFGTSKATAIVASFLIEYIFFNGKNKTREFLLEEQEQLKEKKKIVNNKHINDDNKNNELLNSFCNIFNIDQEEMSSENMDRIIPWNIRNIRMLEMFLDINMIDIELDSLHFDDFSTVRNLMNTCLTRIKNV